MLERLWFANAHERISLHFLDELVDPLHHFSVLLLPVQIVFPGLV
jgi:hypothetical protein